MVSMVALLRSMVLMGLTDVTYEGRVAEGSVSTTTPSSVDGEYRNTVER